ncbi:MAG TPA: hypothetical protein VK066_05680 [Chloroflexota bacterium]|nr:hypothetical protein [Chloroflexota bacterium]
MAANSPVLSPSSPSGPPSGWPHRPRADSLLRAVVEALDALGYRPVERQRTAAASRVRLHRLAGRGDGWVAHLQVTHRPERHCLQVQPLPTGRTIHWYYHAAQPADLDRIAGGLATTVWAQQSSRLRPAETANPAAAVTEEREPDLDATLLAAVAAGLSGGMGFLHSPEECCECCGAFWQSVADLLSALEAEVRRLHAHAVALGQACAALTEPAAGGR